MSSPGLLDEILTEFDEGVGGELNLDPLGLQAIWSAYGQAIFLSRVSSISNDVRNYTLNLLNHRVVKSLIDDDAVVLFRGLQQQPAYARGKDSQAFKQACLIHLENLFVYAMVQAQRREDVVTGGVLGITKARRLWEQMGADPLLIFSHDDVAHVLKRQNSLGVSGRYKTPLLQMKFFDGAYDYGLPESATVWRNADEHLFGPLKPLSRLYGLASGYLKELLAQGPREPRRLFSTVPKQLKLAFVEAFKAPPAVGAYARHFWLSVTGLDQGASGALYRILNDEHRVMPKEPWPAMKVFERARQLPALAAEVEEKLRHVVLLEPFLGELDLLMNAMLSAKTQSLNDAAEKWRGLGRTDATLGKLAKNIVDDPVMRKRVAGTPLARLTELIEIARATSAHQQMEKLLAYHGKIMDARGQSPWLRLVGGQQLKVDVRTRDLPNATERPVGSWIHHYYIPQYRLLLSGLRGAA